MPGVHVTTQIDNKLIENRLYLTQMTLCHFVTLNSWPIQYAVTTNKVGIRKTHFVRYDFKLAAQSIIITSNLLTIN